MAIGVTVVVLNVPYGNPGSIGEPLGIWTGKATVVGDASGGSVECRFVPQNPTTTPLLDDQRLQYVWFLDAVGIFTAPADAGNISARLQTHWARPNSALVGPLDVAIVLDTIFDGVLFGPIRNLVPKEWARIPIFWDTQELLTGGLALAQLSVQNNVLANNYTFSVSGRYYDKQILSNRAFGRLISPPAISQFEG